VEELRREKAQLLRRRDCASGGYSVDVECDDFEYYTAASPRDNVSLSDFAQRRRRLFGQLRGHRRVRKGHQERRRSR